MIGCLKCLRAYDPQEVLHNVSQSVLSMKTKAVFACLAVARRYRGAIVVATSQAVIEIIHTCIISMCQVADGVCALTKQG